MEFLILWKVFGIKKESQEVTIDYLDNDEMNGHFQQSFTKQILFY